MSGHTPSPWTFDPATGAVSTSNAKTVCYVSTIGTKTDAFDVAKANGFVLAAAPELLAALQLLVQWHGKRATRDFNDDLLPFDQQESEMQVAMAAITKATGK